MEGGFSGRLRLLFEGVDCQLGPNIRLHYANWDESSGCTMKKVRYWQPAVAPQSAKGKASLYGASTLWEQAPFHQCLRCVESLDVGAVLFEGARAPELTQFLEQAEAQLPTGAETIGQDVLAMRHGMFDVAITAGERDLVAISRRLRRGELVS